MSPARVAMRSPIGDDVDCGAIFSRRPAVMKTVPKFLWGSFRVALKVVLEEISEGADARDIVRQE